MKITIPRKRKEVIEFFERSDYEKVGEDDENITYEGVFPLRLPFRVLHILPGEREAFRRELKVDGGYKSRLGDAVDITPYRNDYLLVRISKKMHELLKQCAKGHESSVSGLVRLWILEEIDKWLLAKKKGEESRRRREEAKKRREEQRREEERAYG